MSSRLLQLALDKQRLLLHSDVQRQTLALHASRLAPLFSAADRMRKGVDWLCRHPGLPVVVLVALLVARPRAVWGLAGRVWVVWGMLRRLAAGLQDVQALGVKLGRERKAGAKTTDVHRDD